MSLDWYVVETHPFAEAKAETNLRRQGFETYTPRYRKSRRHARRCDEVMAPLFPRYIFVAIDSARQSLRAIHSTFGVARLVSFGDRPVALQRDVIQQLKARERADGSIAFDRPAFRCGEIVRVSNGPLESYLGLFEGLADKDRVSVLLEFLGRKARVILNPSSVAAA